MRSRIREILRENLNKAYRKIAIFDFDGTLINTPLRDEAVDSTGRTGEEQWSHVTGQEWPHRGWWGRKESLNIDVFEHPPIPDVISAYNREKRDPNTLMVMMTGRLAKLSGEVEKILNKYNLDFDVKLYNGSNGNGGKTEIAKVRHMQDLLNRFPSVKEIEMWDDRDAHIPHFQAFGDSLRGVDFKINHVPQHRH